MSTAESRREVREHPQMSATPRRRKKQKTFEYKQPIPTAWLNVRDNPPAIDTNVTFHNLLWFFMYHGTRNDSTGAAWCSLHQKLTEQFDKIVRNITRLSLKKALHRYNATYNSHQTSCNRQFDSLNIQAHNRLTHRGCSPLLLVTCRHCRHRTSAQCSMT